MNVPLGVSAWQAELSVGREKADGREGPGPMSCGQHMSKADDKTNNGRTNAPSVESDIGGRA